MFDVDRITNNSIIICPTKQKEKLIKILCKNNPFFHVKFFSKDEIIKGFNYKYDFEAINYLNKKYNYNLDNAKEILDNLVDVSSNNHKINMVKTFFDELKNNGLLKINSYFINLFVNKTVFIYGYSKKDDELRFALDKNDIDYNFIEEEQQKIFSHNVIEFDTIEQEINYVFNQIFSLISLGIDLNQIYLYSFPEEYEFLLKKYAKYHNISIEFKNDNTLYDSVIFKQYVELLNEYSIDDAYEIIKERIFSNSCNNVLNSLIESINKIAYLNLEKEDFKLFLTYIAKNTKLKITHFDHSIKIIDANSVIEDDEYVFMLGFSLDSYPRIYKDIDFFTDEEKILINKNTSRIKTEIEEEQIIKFILHTKNLIISYKNKRDKNIYYPSLIIKKLDLNTIKKSIDNKRYSLSLAKIEVAKAIDMNYLYGVDNKIINTFTKKELCYKSYDHRYKKINDYYNDNNLILSYTQINEFNSCPFQYFLKRVLKLEEYNPKFETKLGTLYHLILQDSLSKDIDLINYSDYIDSNFITAKEKFFLNNLLPQVFDVIQFNKEFANYTNYNKLIPEYKFCVDVDNKTKITGSIDKIMIDEQNKSLIVVDYKTYSFNFDIKKVKYGFDLQLPIYSYMLDKEFGEYINVGMYIQNVLSNNENINNERKCALDGLTIEEENKVKRLDKLLGQYENNVFIKKSKFIENISIDEKNMSIKKNKALLDQVEYNNLKVEAENQIKKAIQGIRNGDFEIAPVRFLNEYHGDKKSCQYCSFNNICHMDSNDFRDIDLKETENK